jgi:hypothetical protein
MVKYRFSAPFDMGSNPIRCLIQLNNNNILYIYFYISLISYYMFRIGIEPIYLDLQTKALPLSYLNNFFSLEIMELESIFLRCKLNILTN